MKLGRLHEKRKDTIKFVAKKDEHNRRLRTPSSLQSNQQGTNSTFAKVGVQNLYVKHKISDEHIFLVRQL
jgi:hypothetical protein